MEDWKRQGMCWKSFEGRATQLTRCQLPTQSNAMQIKPGRALHVRKLDNLKVEQHIFQSVSKIHLQIYVQELQEIEAMVAEDRKIEAMTEGGAFR